MNRNVLVNPDFFAADGLLSEASVREAKERTEKLTGPELLQAVGELRGLASSMRRRNITITASQLDAVCDIVVIYWDNASRAIELELGTPPS